MSLNYRENHIICNENRTVICNHNICSYREEQSINRQDRVLRAIICKIIVGILLLEVGNL